MSGPLGKQALLLLALCAGCRNWRAHVDPARAAQDPEQGPLDDATPITFEAKHFQVTLTPRASYHLVGYAVETSRELLDQWDFVMPLDVGVAWGDPAAPTVLARLSFPLSERDLSRGYHMGPGLAALPADLASHLANNHLIPATDEVRRTLDRIRIGDLVDLRGQLVDVRIRDRDGRLRLAWPTSLSRSDVGSGACEVFWVEEATRERP